MDTMTTIRDLEAEAARYERDAEDYRQHAASLSRRLSRLTGDDPEDDDAAGEWMRQLAHAESNADRYAWRATERRQEARELRRAAHL